MQLPAPYRLFAMSLSGYLCLVANIAHASTPQLSLPPPNTQDQFSSSPSNTTSSILSKPFFLTGIIVGSVGAASALTFGILGFAQSKKLADRISNGIDHTSYDRIAKKGATYNSLTMTGAILTGIGYTTAIVVYAIDYNRCGTLAPRSRRCQRFQDSSARWQWRPSGIWF